MSRLDRATWDTYLARYHEDRPGITETILTRCANQGQNPYEWLTEGLTTSGVTLDLACGSAPTRPRIRSGWLGIDASEAELHAAELDSTGRAVRGDLASNPSTCRPSPRLDEPRPNASQLPGPDMTWAYRCGSSRPDHVDERRAPLPAPERHGRRSSSLARAARSFRFARRIAGAMNGASSFEKPAGSPRLRSVMWVPPSLVDSHV